MPAPPTEQLEFGHSVEGLFLKGLGEDLGPAQREALRAAGLDLSKRLLPAYPAADFHRWIEVAALQVFRGQPRDEALRQVGRRAVPGLEETLLGKAVASVLRLIGPGRTVERLHRVFRNNGNYQEIIVNELASSHARITVRHVFGVPMFYVGVLERAGELIGAQDVTVKVERVSSDGADLWLSWK